MYVRVTVGHLFVVIEYRHDDECVTVSDDRNRQNESEHQHVDVEQSIRERFGRVVPRTRSLETLQHVPGPAEYRRHRHRQTVYPHEHADLHYYTIQDAYSCEYLQKLKMDLQITSEILVVVWWMYTST